MTESSRNGAWSYMPPDKALSLAQNSGFESARGTVLVSGGGNLLLSQFEYISIAVSLVLAFGLTRLLSGLPHVIQGERRYWVHGFWCLQAVVNYAMFWWLFWNWRHVEDWTLGAFLLTLPYPALCYVGATILIPSDASRGTEWRAYYFDARKAIFAIFGIATATLGMVGIVLNDEPILSPFLYVSSAFVVLYAVGFISDRPRVQGAIVLINALLIVIVYAPRVYRPF